MMNPGYGTIYNIKTKGQPDPLFYGFAACFSGHYKIMMEYEELNVFVLENYNNGWMVCKASNNPFTKEQIYEYADLLKQIGFNFDLFKTEIKIVYGRDEKKVDAYQFKIHIQENSNLSNLYLVNFIRYIFELQYNSIIPKFIEFAKNGDPELLFNKLMLAHYNGTHSSGHCILRQDGHLLGIYEKKEFETKVLNNKERNLYSSYQSKRSFRAVTAVQLSTLKTFFQKPFEELIKKYKTLHEK